MQSPGQIQFINIQSSEAVEAAINKWPAQLDRAYPAVLTCRVSVEAPSRKKLRGGRYHTRIDSEDPGASSFRVIGKHHIAGSVMPKLIATRGGIATA